MHSLCTFRISYPYVRNEDFVFLKPQMTMYDWTLFHTLAYDGAIHCGLSGPLQLHCTENHVVLYI